MTIEQKEQQILKLVYGLPILRRIRLALTILKEVEPNQIPVGEDHIETIDKHAASSDEELAEKLIKRKEFYLNGEGANLTSQDFMAKIYGP